MKPIIAAAALAAGLTAGQAGAADDVTLYEVEGSFDDATFGVETAITNRGLVVDWVSHVGDMLNRTGADVGSDVRIFEKADIFLFCSAILSREVMEADPLNLAHCPYAVFAYEAGDGSGDVYVGYRHMPEGEMQKVQALLDEIAREAAGLD